MMSNTAPDARQTPAVARSAFVPDPVDARFRGSVGFVAGGAKTEAAVIGALLTEVGVTEVGVTEVGVAEVGVAFVVVEIDGSPCVLTVIVAVIEG